MAITEYTDDAPIGTTITTVTRRRKPVRIPAARYTDPAWAELEQQRVWAKTWQLACTIDHVTDPGDWYEYTVGQYSVVIVRDDDGYFRTGDLGTLDADGYVVITGRSKDVIIRNAENISAKEVEDLLYTHPKVLDVAVVGLSDAKTGERVCAVVASSDANDPLTVADMRDFLREQGLRRQAVPEQLELVDVIPRNAAGKVTKNVLRDRFNNQPRNQ